MSTPSSPISAPTKSSTTDGVLYALTAAICYGLIPTFVLPIRSVEGVDNPHAMSDSSILFYRFFIAAVIIGIIMLVRRRSFRITRGEAVTLIYLSFLSDGAALFLLAGYDYMSSGVATTIHFLYPVVTAIIMMFFYGEARRPATIAAVLMAVIGVALLSWPTDGQSVGFVGIILELISALCFALYLIRVNRSRIRDMDSLRLTFYVMLFGSFIFAGEAFRQDQFQLITTSVQLTDLLLVGFICTVITNLCLVAAVKSVGSTFTAVLGALEPLTAVVLGCLLFGEVAGWNVITGIALIIPAVIMIILTRRR